MDAYTLAVIGTVLLGLAIAAALPYLIFETRWRWRWREVQDGQERVYDGDGDLYRRAGDVPRYRTRAPAMIRWAAFTCFLFGQMFIPGLVLGGLGLVLGGIGLVMVPGLIANAKLYFAGVSLLKREPRVTWFRVRNAALWVYWVHGVILTASAALGLLIHDGELWIVLGLINGYGLICIGQALFLQRAAAASEDALFLPSAYVAWGPKAFQSPPETAGGGAGAALS